jgi:signal transduction histidine kinase
VFLLHSVRNWLTLLFLLLIAVASTASWLWVVPPLKDRLITQKLQDLATNSPLVFNAVKPAIGRTEDGTFTIDQDAASASSYAVDQRIGARIAFFSPGDLKQIADSRFGQVLRARDFVMLRQTAQSGKATVGKVRSGGVDYAAVAVPIVPVDPKTHEELGLAAIGLIVAPLGDVYSAVALVERQILLATGLALGVTLVTGFVASLLIARRLKRIERGAEAIAGGDFKVTLKVRVRDEIGQLAASFNAMGLRLRQAFTAIEQEKRSAETMLDTLNEGIIGMTADGRVLMHNPAAAQFLGRRLVVGASADAAFPEEVARMWSDIGGGGSEAPVVFELRGRTLEALGSPVGADTDLASVVVLRDVTQQERLERARREFVANASHEFKTPLFSLSGFLELLDEDDANGEERREYLGLMKDQVERLQTLSHRLLDLSQVDAGAVRLEPRSVNLVTLAESVSAEFQARAAERHLVISITAATHETTALCDEGRMAQVLRALLDNAIKFTGRGGQIAVTVSREEDCVTLDIADTGAGISPAELPRIFDRFYRGSPSQGSKVGTGLGLSIARDLMHLMGGSIDASSRPGRGSRFTLTLPAERGEVTAGHAAS